MAIEPIDIKIEVVGDSGNGGASGGIQPRKPLPRKDAVPKGENKFKVSSISSVLNALPYGQTVAQGINLGESVVGTLTGSTFGLVIGGLTVLKGVHTISKNYVWDKRRAEEMQRRAGLKTRGE